MAVVGNAVFLPASVVVLAMGVWMVLISGWDFEDVWVALGLVGVVATAITGSTVIGPRLKRIGDAIAERGAEDTRVQDDIGRLVAIARIDVVVLFLVVAVMVIKPGS